MGEGSGVALSCGVDHRCGSDPAWLWLGCRPAAVAPVGPLAWEPPCAMGAGLKSKKLKKKKKECLIDSGSPVRYCLQDELVIPRPGDSDPSSFCAQLGIIS